MEQEDIKIRKVNNEKLIMLHTLLLNMIFIVPVIVPYYIDKIGIGFREFMIGEAAFAAVVILSEVPTGWLSDVWSRKQTMIAGTFVNVLGYVLLLQADSFAMAILAQSVLGIAVSLHSGTGSALLYDSLDEEGRTDEFRRIEGFRHGLGLYTVGFSCLIGGWLYGIDRELPIILGIVTSCGALLVNFFFREPERHKEVNKDKHPLKDMLDTMRYALHGHPAIAGIILFAAILFATTKVLMWAQQPYYLMLELPLGLYGVFMAVGLILGGAAGHFGHHLDGKHSNIAVLTVLFTMTFAALLISGLWPGYHGIALLLCGSLIWGFGNPRLQEAVNKRVGPERRATILSTASLMIQLTFIPFSFLSGWLDEKGGITLALTGQAIVLVVLGVLAIALLKANGKGKSRNFLAF